MKLFFFLLAQFCLLSLHAQASSVRLKDLVEFEGVRGNDLVGYGLVVGLNGTGDGLRNSPFTEEILSNLLERLGVNITGEKFKPKNIAAVIATANLHAFARAGSQIDVTVSAIGDAKSLRGGTLVLTPLKAADGEIYAIAQGAIIAGGFSAEGQASKIVTGVPTSGAIPAGARIEREVNFNLNSVKSLKLALREPDFTTARRIETSINDIYGKNAASMIDAGTVQFDIAHTKEPSTAHALSTIENLEITPTRPARVVIDQRSGTVVLGEDVKISNVAISQGNLTIKISETPNASQPNPFTHGETLLVPRTDLSVEKSNRKLGELPTSANLSEVVEGLNALGVKPQDLIDILKSIKEAGALHATLVVK